MIQCFQYGIADQTIVFNLSSSGVAYMRDPNIPIIVADDVLVP